MKKATINDHGPSAKRQAAPATVEEYLARVPEPALSTLRKIRATIRSVVPRETTEALSYGIPTFRYKGWLVAYAAFTKHCSLFPMNSSLIVKFAEELKDYPKSKGTIRFPVDRPLPSALVKKIVRERLVDQERKEQGRKRQ